MNRITRFLRPAIRDFIILLLLFLLRYKKTHFNKYTRARYTRRFSWWFYAAVFRHILNENI